MTSPAPPQTFEVTGYGGAPVPCVLHGGAATGVALVLPGAATDGNRLGGTPARPDLHFTRALLRAEGLAVFELWWDAGTAPEEELEDWLDANADAGLRAATIDRTLAFLVGRSLGTLGLARLVDRHEALLVDVPTVWLAPLLRRPAVGAAIERRGSSAFVVGGTADPAFPAEAAEQVRAAGAQVLPLEGAHHGLEVDDPVESARLLTAMLTELRAFVRAQARSRAGVWKARY